MWNLGFRIANAENVGKGSGIKEGAVSGTSLDPTLLAMAGTMWHKTISLEGITDIFNEVFHIKPFRSTIHNSIKALANALKETNDEICKEEETHVEPAGMDETTCGRFERKRVYPWVAVSRTSIVVRVAPSRAGCVIGRHFSFRKGKPITVDGFSAYVKKFEIRQRCWAHVNREAERLT